MSSSTPQPTEIARALSQRVLGQEEAVREVSIAVAKRLAGLTTGNILMIGSSGTGKTSLMRAVEIFLASDPELARHSTLVRVHANVLAEQTVEGRAGEVLLTRILDRAREQLGDDAPLEDLLSRVSRAVVFVDEVDKIRSVVGGQPNVLGIRAQEALLTLIENEAVPFSLPNWAGGKTVTLDASGLLFVAAGAFEGLYDSVYDRVTIGTDRGSLQSVSVLGEGSVHEELQFTLRDWLRYEDLFDYGLTPQFLSRFDALVLLNDLGEDELLKIFLEGEDSGLHQARAYFEAMGLELALSPAAARRIALESTRQPRLGARALKEVFRRVMRSYEFEPQQYASDGTLIVDVAEVEEALAGRSGLK
jgi:ATP-dependent Clp protease ATP-binding subunit ClpX